MGYQNLIDLEQNDTEIVVFSNRPRFAHEMAKSVHPYEVRLLDGAGATGCAQMQNRCVATSKRERVIVSRDKAQASAMVIEEMVRLFNQGFGVLMSGWNTGFFGINKEVFRRIGGFDEGFCGGGFEDGDLLLRCCEGDIAWCEVDAHVSYNVYPCRAESVWKEEQPKAYYFSKWDVTNIRNDLIRRRFDEPLCKYDWGPSKGAQLKPWASTKRRSHPEDGCQRLWKVLRSA